MRRFAAARQQAVCGGVRLVRLLAACNRIAVGSHDLAAHSRFRTLRDLGLALRVFAFCL